MEKRPVSCHFFATDLKRICYFLVRVQMRVQVCTYVRSIRCDGFCFSIYPLGKKRRKYKKVKPDAAAIGSAEKVRKWVPSRKSVILFRDIGRMSVEKINEHFQVTK